MSVISKHHKFGNVRSINNFIDRSYKQIGPMIEHCETPH